MRQSIGRCSRNGKEVTYGEDLYSQGEWSIETAYRRIESEDEMNVSEAPALCGGL